MAELTITPSGDVFGPSSATDNAIARFDGTTGKLIQNSGVTVDDSNNIDSPASASFRGAYNESTTTAGLYVGKAPDTPRVLFANGTAADNWQIDNDSGNFRWFTPGAVWISLNRTTGFSVTRGLHINGEGGDFDSDIRGDNDANLFYVDASADRVGIGTNTPGAKLDVAGSFQCDSITNDTGLASGVYTPTRSAEANMDANVTMTEAQYMRVGSTVTVSGRFTADPTLAATATSFEITLPVASNIGAAEDVAGVAFCGNIASMGAEVIGVAANNTAQIQWKSSDITSQVWSYTFTYQVI